MIRKIITIALSALLGLAAYAQGIDAEVSVTGDYEATLGRLAKQGMQMYVPDTAYHFNYSFDYSVFDSPYKGAYEFSPYTVKIVPEAVRADAHTLYAKAGLGYSLNPLLQAVYSPAPKGDFSLSLYQDLHGYLGNYWGVGSDLKLMRSQWFGSDLSEDFGVNLAWRKKAFMATVDAGYRGIYTYEPTLADYMNSLAVRGRIRSNANPGDVFYYDVALSVRALNDYAVTVYDPVSMFHCSYDLQGTVGPIIRGFELFTIGFEARHDDYYQIYNSGATLLSATPAFSLSRGPVRLNIGATVSWAGSLHFNPMASVRGSFADGVLDIEAGVKGGARMHDFYSFKDKWSRFNASFTSDISAVEHERFNAYLLAEGRIGHFFQYGVKGGYAGLSSSPMLSIAMSGTRPAACIRYVSYNYAYADMSAAWTSERVDVIGTLALRKSGIGSNAGVFDIPLVEGGLQVRYNWYRRIFAEASFSGMTERRMAGYRLPAYGDLGLSLEYRMPRMWGFWIEGSNLLDMAIQRLPGFVERGVNIRVGASLYL